MFQEHSYDFQMTCRDRRLDWCGLEIVMGWSIDGRSRFDQILCYVKVTEITGKPQRLKSIFCIRVDEFWVSRQQSYHVMDLAGRRGFEDRQRDLFSARKDAISG